MAGMREIGIRCVVAESYLFPFFRSELASGMMLFILPGGLPPACGAEINCD